MLKIMFDNTTKTWTRTVEQLGDSGTRILEQKQNYTDFYDKNKEYINLYLKLDLLGSPQTYKMMYFTESIIESAKGQYRVSDFSDVIIIPIPEFVISSSPSTLALRPGEEKTIKLLVNTSIAPQDFARELGVRFFKQIGSEIFKDWGQTNELSHKLNPYVRNDEVELYKVFQLRATDYSTFCSWIFTIAFRVVEKGL